MAQQSYYACAQGDDANYSRRVWIMWPTVHRMPTARQWQTRSYGRGGAGVPHQPRCSTATKGSRPLARTEDSPQHVPRVCAHHNGGIREQEAEQRDHARQHDGGLDRPKQLDG